MMQAVAHSEATARWAARILSVAIGLFWGFFFVAHLFGDAGRSSRPLGWADYVILGALLVALGGLALSWKWEGIGAAITLIAVAVGAAVNWKVLVFPGTLIPVAAFLFLVAWWLSEKGAPHVLGQQANG
jgi:hypothetical protein